MPGRVTFAVTAAPSLSVIVGHVDYLAEQGWQVDVVVGEAVDRALFPRAGVHVLRMRRGTSPASDARALAEWRRLLKRLRPDVLVAANPKASLLALAAARSVGVPQRVWWLWDLRHFDRASRMRRRVELAAERLATVTIAGSASLADEVVAAGVTHRPLVLGSGAVAGVDLDVFYPADGPTPEESGDFLDLRESSRATPRPPTVVCAGRLAGDRGLDYLTEIWPQVQSQVPAARLIIAGGSDPLDPPGPALEFLIAHPGVEFRGYVEDVAELLRGCDVLLEPATSAWLPEVVLEAAATAVPTVGWNVPGLRDTVDAQTGILLSPGDVAGFVDATTALLTDPARARAMGAAAREFVAERFERTRVERLFAELLEGLVDERVAEPRGSGNPQAGGDGTSEVPVTPSIDLRSPAAHTNGSRGRRRR